MSNIKRAYSTFFFAILFMSIGYVLPAIYHNFLDYNSYLLIENPISLNKARYNVCDNQTIFSTYTSQFDISIKSNNDLNKLNEDGTFTKVFSDLKLGTFKKAEGEPFSVQLKVPCDLEPGIYFWSGIKTYSIKGHIKNYSFTTDSFEVRRGKNGK